MEAVSLYFLRLFKGRFSSKLVARLMWALPALLLVISLALLKAGFDERTTLRSGELLTAQVVDVEIRNRADVTYGHIDLHIVLPDGEVLAPRLPLPLSLLTSLEGLEEVDVRVLPGGAKEVVIDRIARAQWRMSLIHSAMSGVGALLLIIAVGAWNRFLDREGDPAGGQSIVNSQ